ncbi:MAG: bifunctional phosphopantothenoylcysteine decarboxylase/phosphopantothenate--cysteine ligase CoaBC [Firmicutes bacterium]|nr:bifunctional phosphopantothenoylcysteine decarboxylase/phosphopantothenate--cysteine ligase CoaBC [Candidatus Fermentithermobacillaceae bacterium]HOV66670.1 bifunctional phosphopantothenoylcysteine decarboxylase/phosphopantothenate--cysteine ligase CoaBC [Bacillota bacterium]HRC53624.1 bifunctional phosphopantothenoylcysteine decarboxylase/phosphopantothenate--cysteine ligase CoaBC [Bacillota bacterium]
MLSGKNIVVGVSGGIAAYKTVDVVSRLRKLGAETHVVMTENATKLVAPLTFRTISAQPVIVHMFEEPKQWNVEHIALAEMADLFVLCPATANCIGKIANGIADDFLTTTVMACTCPVIICPAMNHNMYENKVVQQNISKLKGLGYEILEPEYGRLASGAVGKGRLPDPEKIVEKIVDTLSIEKDLKDVTFLVTAGPTREWIDPVRYISNPSTGKMGYAIAEAAAKRGAKVYLVSGPSELVPPFGVILKKVDTTEDMLRACLEVYPEVQVVIGCAAPGDFKPVEYSEKKIKKQGDVLCLALSETVDILKTLGENKGSRILVGFAAETDDVVENAKAKIIKKNLDFICANQVGLPDRAFGADTNAVTIIMPDGTCFDIGPASKYEVAMAIIDQVKNILDERRN